MREGDESTVWVQGGHGHDFPQTVPTRTPALVTFEDVSLTRIVM